jgi:hypothetical protein
MTFVLMTLPIVGGAMVKQLTHNGKFEGSKPPFGGTGKRRRNGEKKGFAAIEFTNISTLV